MTTTNQTWHDRAPAPGRLALVQDFVNSLDLEESSEGFAQLADVHGWLVARHLIEPNTEITEPDRHRLIALREAIRELLSINSGEAPKTAAIAIVNQHVERADLRPTFDRRGQAALTSTASGVEQAIGIILAAIVEATANGTWLRLKVCSRPTCRWAFYDASRSRGGRWCTMAICGNRAKVGEYRRRRRPAADSQDPGQAPTTIESARSATDRNAAHNSQG